jgi:hypothetical protein
LIYLNEILNIGKIFAKTAKIHGISEVSPLFFSLSNGTILPSSQPNSIGFVGFSLFISDYKILIFFLLLATTKAHPSKNLQHFKNKTFGASILKEYQLDIPTNISSISSVTAINYEN